MASIYIYIYTVRYTLLLAYIVKRLNSRLFSGVYFSGINRLLSCIYSGIYNDFRDEILKRDRLTNFSP